MPGLAWILVGWFVLNIIVSIATIGKAPPVRTPSAGVVSLFLYGGLIYAVLKLAEVL